MSFYATIQGQITYSTQEAFNKAMELLKKMGYVDNEGYFLDEVNERIHDTQDIQSEHLMITIPWFCHCNLARYIEDIFQGGKGKVVETSTDGCFEGGVYVDGEVTGFDLAEWGKENVLEAGEKIPDLTENMDENVFEEYIEMLNEIEFAFHEKFFG